MVFMYPYLLHMTAHLHLLWNSLESACKKMSQIDKCMESLRAVSAVLSDKQLRQKSQAECLIGTAAYPRFTSYPRVHIDWRWEFLSAALDGLLPLWGDLVAYWDEVKMLQGETSKLDIENVKR